MAPPQPTVNTIPPPDKLKAELLALYRVVRQTKTLLRLSERIHSEPRVSPQWEGVHDSR